MLACMVNSCIRTKSCSIEGISRPEDGCGRQSESRVKQAKRWLMSKWTGWDTFFVPYIAPLLGQLSKAGEIVIVMDGSETGRGCTTLMLSVIWGKYAIPVVWTTREGAKGHFSDAVHTELARECLALLPVGQQCRVVLLGDGEFDGQSLHRWCVGRGWQFVTRTACDRHIDFGGEVARFDSIQTTRGIVFIPSALPMANGVFWHGKGHKKPLFLLTNMELGQEACDYYKRRFKIETLFKHLKSAGFHLDKTRLKCSYKLANLIIVVAFAFVFSFCMGAFITANEPVEYLETIVRKDRLARIAPIAIAQLAIGHNASCVINFFSDLSKNFQWIFT